MTFDESLAETVRVLKSLETLRPEIDRASELILRTLRSGGKLIIAGNGGSAAEASHFAAELVGRYRAVRPSLPAIAVPADPAVATCVANDYGFEALFARQVEGLSRPGDLLVVLTTSGNSANILAALDEASKRGLASLALLGRGGGKARGRATCEIVVPGQSGASAQEAHLFLIHHFCERIESEFSPS